MPGRLLVTDDAAIIRAMVKDTTMAAGWEVVGEAVNGHEALERYQELRPDVMTLDLVMPGYDGIYAIEQIRAVDPDARIVVLSALDQKPVLSQAFKLGASDFLVKPFAPEVLLETLERVLEQQSS